MPFCDSKSHFNLLFIYIVHQKFAKVNVKKAVEFARFAVCHLSVRLSVFKAFYLTCRRILTNVLFINLRITWQLYYNQ